MLHPVAVNQFISKPEECIHYDKQCPVIRGKCSPTDQNCIPHTWCNSNGKVYCREKSLLNRDGKCKTKSRRGDKGEDADFRKDVSPTVHLAYPTSPVKSTPPITGESHD